MKSVRRPRARRDSDKGLTLIELLLDTLAGDRVAAVVFAPGGVTARRLVVACESDGVTPQRAAPHASQFNGQNIGTSEQNETSLVDTNRGIPAWPTGTGFALSMPLGVVSMSATGEVATPHTGPSRARSRA
jgi:hypothetical protein